jgi:hypothetical protein
MSNDTSLDIRKVPVAELQTRDGTDVLGVYDDPVPSELGCGRVVIVAKTLTGSVVTFRVSTEGLRLSCRSVCQSDIIRKKQLKGRVLYHCAHGYRVTDLIFTERQFKDMWPTERQFIRILTEVPELPTEEV